MTDKELAVLVARLQASLLNEAAIEWFVRPFVNIQGAEELLRDHLRDYASDRANNIAQWLSLLIDETADGNPIRGLELP